MLVFDSSTLILLAKTELLDLLLEHLPVDAAVPEAVQDECTAVQTFDALLIERRIQEGLLDVRSVDGDDVALLRDDFTLHAGEAETVALALEVEDALVATEDKKAIQACKVLRLPFTTALAVLVRAREKELLATEEASQKLDALARFGRYTDTMIEEARDEVT